MDSTFWRMRRIRYGMRLPFITASAHANFGKITKISFKQ
jgi:hypothetical protein